MVFEILIITFILALIINADVAKIINSFLVLKVLNNCFYNGFFIVV